MNAFNANSRWNGNCRDTLFIDVRTDVQYLDELPTPKVTIAPNPANEEVQITSTRGQMSSVSLFDIDGRKLKVLQPFSETLNMDTQSLKNGLYILKIEWSNGSTANEKLMIAH